MYKRNNKNRKPTGLSVEWWEGVNKGDMEWEWNEWWVGGCVLGGRGMTLIFIPHVSALFKF